MKRGTLTLLQQWLLVYLCIYALVMASKSLLNYSSLRTIQTRAELQKKCLKSNSKELGFSLCTVLLCGSQPLQINLKQSCMSLPHLVAASLSAEAVASRM